MDIIRDVTKWAVHLWAEVRRAGSTLQKCIGEQECKSHVRASSSPWFARAQWVSWWEMNVRSSFFKAFSFNFMEASLFTAVLDDEQMRREITVQRKTVENLTEICRTAWQKIAILLENCEPVSGNLSNHLASGYRSGQDSKHTSFLHKIALLKDKNLLNYTTSYC